MYGRRVVGVLAMLGTLSGTAVAGASGGSDLDPQVVAQGKQIYQRSCASCHGADGEGAPNWQKRNELGEVPPPPHDETGHTWRHADSMLYDMVHDGWRDPFNKTKRLTMPPFKNILSPEEIRAVITYLKTLWTPEQRQFQQEETQARGGFPPAAK
jgi:mono/diheme cytochrome c family protein